MFQRAYNFDQPLEVWNTESVTSMDSMFESTGSFNQSLSAWNTSQVTNMAGMFYATQSFNGSLDGWDTSKVTNMAWMFLHAESFNQPIAHWTFRPDLCARSILDEATSFTKKRPICTHFLFSMPPSKRDPCMMHKLLASQGR